MYLVTVLIVYLLLSYHAASILLSVREMAIARLRRGSVLYPRPLEIDEVREVVAEHEKVLGTRLVPFLPSIVRLAHGHYGAVKYICQLIAENNYIGIKITETQIIKWVRERGDMSYFLHYVWAGLDKVQQGLIRRWIASRGKGIRQTEKGVREMVDVGLWFLGGGDIKWRIPWIGGFVADYVATRSESVERAWGETELCIFGARERRLFSRLLRNQGSVVTYAELGEAVWGEDTTLYSQWALSQLVARIRKKLSQVAPELQVVTERGVGWRLVL